jgi:hypothetical protein
MKVMVGGYRLVWVQSFLLAAVVWASAMGELRVLLQCLVEQFDPVRTELPAGEIIDFEDGA